MYTLGLVFTHSHLDRMCMCVCVCESLPGEQFDVVVRRIVARTARVRMSTKSVRGKSVQIHRPASMSQTTLASRTRSFRACVCVCLCLFHSPRRDAGPQEHHNLRVLPRAVRRRHVHDKDPPPDAVLFFQFNRAVRPDFVHGAARLHVAAGLRREADTG